MELFIHLMCGRRSPFDGVYADRVAMAVAPLYEKIKSLEESDAEDRANTDLKAEVEALKRRIEVLERNVGAGEERVGGVNAEEASVRGKKRAPEEDLDAETVDHSAHTEDEDFETV